MNQQFFEKVLPTQGNICVVGIKGEIVRPKFFDNIPDAMTQMAKLDGDDFNTFFALGTFEGMKRRADACIFMRSFFVDLDCGENKPYPTWEDGLIALMQFVSKQELPPPIIVNSGRGIHAYWPFTEEVPAQVWKPYAEKFKQFCLDSGLHIDESVTADAARILRSPGSRNLKGEPLPVEVINDAEPTVFDVWVDMLGVVEKPFDLSDVERGLDEDTKAIYDKLSGNFEYNFNKIAVDSLEGHGCAQIKFILENADSCPEPLWYAGISVAARCVDGDTAIHQMSEGHPNYDKVETERKAAQSLREAKWSHSCDAFEKENSINCQGCPHRARLGKVGPIGLGKVLKTVEDSPAADGGTDGTVKYEVQDEAESVRDDPPAKTVQFPDYLKPFSRGVNGGIYWTPPLRSTKKGMVQDPDELIIPFTVYPIERMESPLEGACMLMQVELPLDGNKEFIIKMRDVGAIDRLKNILADNSIPYEPTNAPKIASYLMKWATFLTNAKRASLMRMQQGWTDDKYESFVLGQSEYFRNGEIRHTPPTIRSRNVVRNINTSGTLEGWQKSINMFGDPGYEWHAFAVLCGMASPLIEFTNVNGVILSLYGETGFGKTGALYGGLSIWGHPERLAVYDATSNALIGRMITCKNILYGLDEQGNRDGHTISHIAHNISSGQPKLRMSGSDNSERDVAFVTKLIAIMTTNHRMKDIMSTYKGDTKAEEMRVLEPNLRRPNHPGYELTDERGYEMFELLKQHYGHAGPILIQEYLRIGPVKLKNEIKARYLETGDKFSNSAEYRFLSNLRTVTAYAGEIAVNLGLVDWNLARIFSVIDHDLENIIAGKADDENDRAENILGDFISKNIQNALVLKDFKVVIEPKQALNIRAEVDEGEMWISTAAMKEFLKLQRLSVSWFEEQLHKRGMLKCKERKQMAAGWKSGLGHTNMQAYRLNMKIDHLFKHDEEQTDQAA